MEVFKEILDKQWNPKPNNYHGSTAIFIFEWFIPPAISPLLQKHKWGTVKVRINWTSKTDDEIEENWGWQAKGRIYMQN